MTTNNTPVEQATAEERAAETRKTAREMTLLALAKGFSLKHGLREPQDAQGLTLAQEELRGALKERLEGEQELFKLAVEEKEKEKAKWEKAPERERFSRFLMMEAPSGALVKKDAFDKEQEAREQTLALEVLRRSGALDRLSDAASRHEMIQLAGAHKSQSELRADGEALENRLDHYSIQAIVGDGGAFERFETVDWREGQSALASDVKDKSPRRMRSVDEFFGLPFKKPASPGAQRMALGLLGAQGEPVFGLSLKRDDRFGMIHRWSMGAQEQLEYAMDDTGRRLEWAEQNGWASVCAEIAQKAPKDSELGQAWALMEEVMHGADAIAQEDKAKRICEWFDARAGEGASALAEKVWGGSVPAGLRLGELETMARRSKELWAALEGQEALGLFSIRMAERLGLELSGRDLAERAKEKMKQAGLTDGGWRLLGKMDPSAAGEANEWVELICNRSGSEDMLMSYYSRLLEHELAASMNEEGRRELVAKRERERQEESSERLELMARALSACAARGMDAEAAQGALAALRHSGSLSGAGVFGSQVEAPEGASSEEAAAEREAKRARAPKILGDWLALAAKSHDKAIEAFQSVRDWHREAEWGVWQQMPESAGWGELMARQKRWHEMVQERERSERAGISWEPLSPGWSDPATGFSAVPLTDGGMLWDEGKAMRHCVSSYASDCEEGDCRIFSIRKEGERFGTAEVRIGDGSFEVVQFKGYCNRPIEDERAWAAARAAARQCQEAVALKSAAISEISEGGLADKLRSRRAGWQPRLPAALARALGR